MLIEINVHLFVGKNCSASMLAVQKIRSVWVSIKCPKQNKGWNFLFLKHDSAFPVETFPFWQKFDQRSSWKSCHLIFLSSASSKTQIYFQHVNVFKMLLTIIMTMVMMTIISAMIIITKYSLPTIDFATRYSTRYSDFLLQPYSNPTRSEKSLLVGAC